MALFCGPHYYPEDCPTTQETTVEDTLRNFQYLLAAFHLQFVILVWYYLHADAVIFCYSKWEDYYSNFLVYKLNKTKQLYLDFAWKVCLLCIYYLTIIYYLYEYLLDMQLCEGLIWVQLYLYLNLEFIFAVDTAWANSLWVVRDQHI